VSTDYYELLDVAPTATAEELKRAYRRKARELHPDANPEDPDASERFKEIAVAYEVLSDPDKRARYDRFGPEGLNGADAGDTFRFAGGGIGDLFDAFFGGGSPFGGGQRTAGPPRGQDLEVVIDIEFTDAVFGTQAPVTVRTAVACEPCSGSGAGSGTTPVTCADCGGAGQVRRVRQSLLGQMMTTGTCPRCGGLGQVIATPCPSCRGEGRVIEEKTYKVDVPAGVDAGATLRLNGRGAVGPRNGASGDLYVHLRVRQHPVFRREGYDLIRELRISYTQAALGTEFQLETLDGAEALVVPPGTQHGRVLRLRGRGVPHVDGRGRGDVLVPIVVEIPTKLGKGEEDLLRQLAEERGDDVSPPEKGLLGRIKSAFS
jgi:molecular chaperone DnaJ